jgi:bacterioferritin
MENHKNVIETLNHALSLEWAGNIQYLQHSFLVHGLWRELYKPFFRSRASECQDHAKLLGEKIAAFGGLPTVEPAPIKQSREIEEMLQQDLELEKAAVVAYKDVLNVAKDDVALRHMMETLIETETRSVEELEKMLSLKLAKMKEKEIRLKVS